MWTAAACQLPNGVVPYHPRRSRLGDVLRLELSGLVLPLAVRELELLVKLAEAVGTIVPARAKEAKG